jgi:hypothetical protein
MLKAATNQWVVPAFAVVIGVVYLIAGLAGGQTTFGISGLVIMLVFAAGMWLLRGRSETVQGLLDHRDERINDMDLRATAAAGAVVLVVTIGAFVVDVARGNSGAPYYWLGAIGGVAYVVALVVQRVRR